VEKGHIGTTEKNDIISNHAICEISHLCWKEGSRSDRHSRMSDCRVSNQSGWKVDVLQTLTFHLDPDIEQTDTVDLRSFLLLLWSISQW